ncbi:hypothetical protein GCM10023085_64750 [Actinomadura viridis]|uniref:DNA-binding MarR family transcriptional regulator n=1 Tax=Actinomadura viridis TaxID=58110 RepID=A0A931GME2_9ACTN|nr:MarR family transcriptional regulator [Actinomadura viridis]MBG6093108.1 DNA-binding MarR family transcriptional regulator [Actinomadura viridis]
MKESPFRAASPPTGNDRTAGPPRDPGRMPGHPTTTGRSATGPGRNGLSQVLLLANRLHCERTRSLDSELRAMGLTRIDYLVLAALAAPAGEPCPLSVLSRRVAAHPTTVAGTVGLLERRGLVARSPHPTDRRITLVEITPAGAERVGAADTMIEAARPELLGAVYDDHRRLLEMLGPLVRTSPAASLDGSR